MTALSLIEKLRLAHVTTGQRMLGEAAERIEALEAALEPFADKANEYDNPCFPYHDSSLQTGIPVGWLRQARKALGEKQ